MSSQLTTNADALRLFFTDDVYLVGNDTISLAMPTNAESVQSAENHAVNQLIENNEPRKSWDFEFLGNNQQGILILVNDQNNKVSSQQGIELLRKLLKAINLKNDDFALVNYAGYHTASFADLHQFFNCKLVLSFGVSSEELGLESESLHSLIQMGTVRLIFTHNLHDLDSDQQSKKTLWGALQQLNNIKS